MESLDQHDVKNKAIDNAAPTYPPEGLLAMKHLYSAAMLNTFIRPAAGQLSEKELNRVVQELLPGPAERIPMKN